MINRIILIGNGFDLAHGMKTSYRDFIDKYWNDKCEEYEKNEHYLFECEEFSINSKHNTYYENTIRTFSDLDAFAKDYKRNFTSKNNFFINLSRQLNYEGWVDIESAFYDNLKAMSILQRTEKSNMIDVLNKSFEGITRLIEKHLTDVQNSFKIYSLINDRITEIINQPIVTQDLSELVIRKIIDDNWQLLQSHIEEYNGTMTRGHYLTSNHQKIVKNFVRENTHSRTKGHFTSYILRNFSELFISEKPYTEFINFNYTSTESHYTTPETHICHIHGELNSKENPIIFGYGDELDEHYKEIEKLNDNRYLDNVKSINYAKTDNYKKVLNMINDGLFQVFILGHSCGNSDRTLLNTIFEHENCASIKVFYHQKNETEDNFLDIYKNISRNFNSKAKLRDRVVNKFYSEPLIPFKLQQEINQITEK